MNKSVSFKNLQYYKFCFYGFLKNLRFFDAFILLVFLDDGLNYFQIGVLYSVREITIQIFEIPSGILADSWGRRKAMLVALGGYLISFIFFYISAQFYLYLMAMILYGFGDAFRSGTHKAMIVDYLFQNDLSNIKTQYYGSTRSWSQMGSSVAALGGAAVVFLSGEYKTIFLFTIIPYIINLVLIWSYPKSLDHQIDINEKQSILKSFKDTFKISVKALSKPAIVRILFSASMIVAVFKSLKDYVQPMIRKLALSLAFLITVASLTDVQKEAVLIGFVYSIIFIITSISSRFAYKVEQYFPDSAKAANAIYLLAAIAILFSGLFNLLNVFFVAIFLFVGLYIAQNVRRPIMVTYVSENVPDKILATGLSVESQLKTIIIVVLSPLVGLLVDTFSVGTGIMICGFIILLCYPLIKLTK